ncbi:hypothetical protein N825_27075 [Skermanella stibiiresistens SB22]|uniref:Uncharacterized protein n=1 Tax=Skermanella stibiiresistens SB22 TaxID=1385369 RepID=W9GUR3_9PROT|nr:hypothetical protein N825_27075 [Skermanella stibiiresistens SB22]
MEQGSGESMISMLNQRHIGLIWIVKVKSPSLRINI